MLNISDIETHCGSCARPRRVVCVDNTFATPVWQKPFELGADLVMHSSTKYFGGHSDVMGGAVVARDRGGLSDQLRDYQSHLGQRTLAVRLLARSRRSLTTLSCRVHAQTHTAARLAHFLHRIAPSSACSIPASKRIPGTSSPANR